MKNEIMNKFSRGLSKANFALRKYSPEILVVAGAVGVVTSTVMACKATTKIADILEEHKKQTDAVHTGLEAEDIEYTEADSKKDLAIIYTQTSIKIAKLYAPSVILGGLSLGAMIASNNMLRKRSAALAAAYATIDRSFKEYRSRVVEKYGEAADKALMYGTHIEKLETEIDENGKKKKSKKDIPVSELDLISPYAIYYDSETSSQFKDDHDHDMFFLKSQQDYLTDLLVARGYVTLNEALDALGIDERGRYSERIAFLKKAGLVVGWKYEAKNPHDNYVDFRVTPTYRKEDDGTYTSTYILDFNVDGNIYDRM